VRSRRQYHDSKVGQVEDINHFIEEKMNEMDAASSIVKTGNLLIDSIINYKYNISMKYHINYIYQLSPLLPDRFGNLDGDLCIILGNAIDNAIEAVQKVHIEQREIIIKMNVSEDVLFISIKNKYNGEIRKNEEDVIITSKQNSVHHGYGLQSIEKIVKKNNGNFVINYDGEYFKLSIFLYLDEI